MFFSLGVMAPFDPHHRLVSSSLFSARTLAFQRLLIAAYGCVTLVISLVYDSVVLRQGNTWFSFFTHLTYIGLMAYFVVSSYYGFNHKPSPSTSFAYPLQRRHKILQALHLLLLSTITTFPFLVTICFWALISTPETFATRYSTWDNISLHVLNTVFTLVEILTTNIPPLPWIALPVCLVILLAYLGVAYITHATQGVYTYAFLDPQRQHSKLAAYIFGIAIAEVIIFVLVRYAILLRDRVSKFPQNHNPDNSEQRAPKEALDEWQEVQWDDEERRESAGSNPISVQSVSESKIGVAS